MTIVYGNTFPIRNELKKLGFRWNPKFKTWDKDYILGIEQRKILEQFSGIEVKYYDDKNGGSNTIIDTIIDTRSYKQRYGKCEDAPCCGCCGVY